MVLDALETREDANNTLICFFADHGEHLGDHHGWQKESFFEQSCRIPFLVSWPEGLAADQRRDDLVCLSDLFGIAASAAGAPEHRDGIDLLGVVAGDAAPRQHLVAYHGAPGSPAFKVMVRFAEWKYIYLANGGLEQLFNLADNRDEIENLAGERADVATRLKSIATEACSRGAAVEALENGALRSFPFREYSPEDNPYRRGMKRIYQFDVSRGVTAFPENPGDALAFFD